MLRLATYNRNAATMPPNSGEITQLAAMLVMVPQLATSQPAAATPAPSTPPTMEWVVDTGAPIQVARRSEEHTSELQSLMRISYAVFCLKKKKNRTKYHTP